jgi:hypothetical protein
MPNFIKIGSGIQSLIARWGGFRDTDNMDISAYFHASKIMVRRLKTVSLSPIGKTRPICVLQNRQLGLKKGK